MEGFGQALRLQRQAAGMRQQDLVEALDRVIARSTLANVEVGRERPSARLWTAIETHLPHWVPDLEPWYQALQRAGAEVPFDLAGPFEILSATYAYTFRSHRAPEEIIQLRQVRALADGANGYGLRLVNSSGSLDLDTEALWGGWVERHERRVADGQTRMLTRFHFDRTLHRGEVHEFATRSWVSQDQAANSVTLRFTRPTQHATMCLNFMGPRPGRLWRFEATDGIGNTPPEPRTRADVLTPQGTGSYTLRIERPAPGHVHGLAWRW